MGLIFQQNDRSIQKLVVLSLLIHSFSRRMIVLMNDGQFGTVEIWFSYWLNNTCRTTFWDFCSWKMVVKLNDGQLGYISFWKILLLYWMMNNYGIKFWDFLIGWSYVIKWWTILEQFKFGFLITWKIVTGLRFETIISFLYFPEWWLFCWIKKKLPYEEFGLPFEGWIIMGINFGSFFFNRMIILSRNE